MITNINAGGRYILLTKYRDGAGDNATVALTAEADLILEWAGERMYREQRVTELSRTNATVADAVESVRKAEEQLRIVMELVK
jgi:hypothetical protein